MSVTCTGTIIPAAKSMKTAPRPAKPIPASAQAAGAASATVRSMAAAVIHALFQNQVRKSPWLQTRRKFSRLMPCGRPHQSPACSGPFRPVETIQKSG
jgi:hypothetical protein